MYPKDILHAELLVAAFFEGFVVFCLFVFQCGLRMERMGLLAFSNWRSCDRAGG